MTVEVIEGEAREVRALSVVDDQGLAGAGTFALAAMSREDFDRRLAAMVEHRRRVAEIQRALMTKDVHYGVIPGTDKPSLYQPGAEVLCDVYRLRARFAVERIVGDGVATPHLSYKTECYLHLGSLDGPVVAHATGTANSWEKRYRYRNAERVCPNCGKPTVIKGKAEYGGGWLCWPKKGGCNTKWRDGDDAIEGQVVGQIDNPDPFDLDVVLDAMASKRAFVHATRRGCAVSDLFTSDVEDLPEYERQEEAGSQHKPPAIERGDGGLIGIAEAGRAPADFELRQTPDGWGLAFRLKQGRKGIKVIAHGPVAEALAAIKPTVVGQRVTCWGAISDESFDKNEGGRKVTITYQVLALERIQTPDVVIPAQSGGLDAEDEAAVDASMAEQLGGGRAA